MDSRELVYLDRLIRTLHALNYLAERIKGRLLLRVHPQHVFNIQKEHGQVFEELLHTCGLRPELVTLKLEIDPINPASHLKLAVANYKTRGYQIAIHRFGRLQADYSLLKELEPEIVHIDSNLFRSTKKLEKTCHHIHTTQAKTLMYEKHTQLFGHAPLPREIDLIQKQTSMTVVPVTQTSPETTQSLNAA